MRVCTCVYACVHRWVCVNICPALLSLSLSLSLYLPLFLSLSLSLSFFSIYKCVYVYECVRVYVHQSRQYVCVCVYMGLYVKICPSLSRSLSLSFSLCVSMCARVLRVCVCVECIRSRGECTLQSFGILHSLGHIAPIRCIALNRYIAVSYLECSVLTRADCLSLCLSFCLSAFRFLSLLFVFSLCLTFSLSL